MKLSYHSWASQENLPSPFLGGNRKNRVPPACVRPFVLNEESPISYTNEWGHKQSASTPIRHLLIEKTFCLETENIPFLKHLRNQLIQALVEFNSTRFSLIVRPHCEATKPLTFWGVIRMQNVKIFSKPATQDVIKFLFFFYEKGRFFNELLYVPSLFHLLIGNGSSSFFLFFLS